MKTLFITLFACAALTGCAVEKTEPKAAKPAPQPAVKKAPSTAKQVIDGVTGKAAVETGKRARTQVDRINAIQERRIADATGEQ